ncbi:MAG TPA: cytochrome-c oxidase, cbb3-type subunit II [Gemmatimonadales bacterium]|jgi:cytochrome c oxidase cbb3-type subunit I/II|nr:cytochrome-c oxidase, cbb3-type subunit II [Gemmatimonadales bacterium]
MSQSKETFHRFLEGKSLWFAVLTTVAIAIGGLVEIIPMFTAKLGPERMAGVTPYTPLEVAGRDIYIREGCYLCHSQMVRPMRAEILRYGEWTRAGEYAYDHPFLLGSRRTGPDLQRVGGKYPDAWHYEHMRDPRSTSPGSIMPTYRWLLTQRYDTADVVASLRALRRVGLPYSDHDLAGAPASMRAQAEGIVGRLAGGGIQTTADREIVAMIAYLQRLGRDGRAAIEAARPASQAAATTGPGVTP